MVTQRQKSLNRVGANSERTVCWIFCIEDGLLSVFAPWCRLAEDAAPFIEDAAWPLRTLLSQIVSKVADGAQRSQLGLAARALLSFALSDSSLASLVTIGIVHFARLM